MKQIKHHLTDELIMGYSAGTLPEAFNLAIATHVSMCDACRAAVESYDAVGGTVLEQCETVEMSAQALADTLAMIKQDGPAAPVAATSSRAADVPAPLADYISGSLDDVKWKPVGMGVKQAILETSKEASARLLYIPAGTAVPDHGHNGTELTLVLRGAFFDEEDYFGPGDIEVATEADEHTPVADIGADCICLAVTDAPLKFRGLLPRLAQPFLRI
ncbi:ChrR family anti-sigma-E factor [Primorskyibacter aestuariivivens]|nr:ChrR family anti-sigma-E factor [Primorskyibacter aestuariivivens]MDA7428303.1 ChrR family anti-sigma-E factor [Primorskyibacter aestuariivivens]